MKTNTHGKGYFTLLGFCLVVVLMMPGCALFGPSVEKAQQVAEKRQDLLNNAYNDFDAAGRNLEALINEYNAAKAAGDTDAVEAIEEVLPSAVAKYKSAEAAYKSAEDVFKAAVADFKDAKSTSDYIGTVFGWITAGLGAVFGGGALVKNAKTGKAAGASNEALEGVTAALEKLKGGGKWDAAKGDMLAKLSPPALKAIDNARP